MGSVYFYFCHHVLCLSPPGWERQAPRGVAPLWGGGGEEDRGKFLLSANLAAPHWTVFALLSFVRLGGGAHAGARTSRSQDLESCRQATQAERRAQRVRPGRGARRPGRVEFILGTELIQSPNSAAKAQGQGQGQGLGRDQGLSAPRDPASSTRVGGGGLFAGSHSRQL